MFYYSLRRLIPIAILAGGLSTVSCIHAGKLTSKTTETPLEDLHVNDTLDYPDSPFDGLIKDVSTPTKEDNLLTHYIHVLDVGDEALLARIHLIRSAKKAIYIQTFIWTDDESGRFVAYELIQAARRGVKVKIIIDMWKSAGPPDLIAYMLKASPDIEIKHYNPSANLIKPSAIHLIPELALRFKRVNQRMHNKVFIVDDRMAITGGRNYENDYFDRGIRRNFKDRDVLVVGPVVRDMTDSFSQYWGYQLSLNSLDLADVGKIMENGNLKMYQNDADLRTDNLFEEIDREASHREVIQKKFIDPSFKVSKVRFISDKPGKNDSKGLAGGGFATNELLKLLSSARKSLVIQTPYLVLDRMMVRSIKKLRGKSKDLDIQISSNSLAAADHVHAYAFAFKQKKLFVKYLKFRIFEFKPVPKDIALMMPRYVLSDNSVKDESIHVSTLKGLSVDGNIMESPDKHLCVHAKTFIVDDKTVWIGSFNLDPRSAHLNTEVGLIIEDERVAQAVRANIERDMAPGNSWTIGKCKDVPVISLFSGIMANALKLVPFVDIWPFRYTTSFELKDGKEEVPYDYPDFYENYEAVGSFPEVRFNLRDVETMLIKAFFGIAEPLI